MAFVRYHDGMRQDPDDDPAQAPLAIDQVLDELAVELPAEAERRAKAAARAPRPELPNWQRRRRRRTRRRAVTESITDMGREIARARAPAPMPSDERPRHRGDCAGGERPCPWVRCKYHLYLDVNPETGTIKLNFPDLEPWELPNSCALDVAERGGITLEEVGDIMNLTRERIRQVEVRGLIKLKMSSPSPEELGAALLQPGGDDDT